MPSCPAASSLYTLSVLITSFINEQTPADLYSPFQLHDGDTYDFIIVGAGSAGCVLANRLSEIRSWSVLLLEAGGEEPYIADVPSFSGSLSRSRIDWAYTSEQQQRSCGGHRCPIVRGKVLGGSSSINKMHYNRGNPLDYDDWEELGNTGWAYQCVLPYFKKSENNLDPDIAKDITYHSTGGYLSVSRFPYVDRNAKAFYEAFRELGYDEVDLSTEHVLGVSFTQGTLRNGERQSTNTAFLEPIRKKRQNLKVVTNVRVTKVLIHPESKTAYGVEYAWENIREIKGRVFARKEVILSAGSFGSPQLLMLSGVGPKETLQSLGIPVLQDSKVGFNLQDHFTAPGLFFNLNNEDQTADIDSKLLLDALNYIQPQKTGRWTGIQSSQVTANINTKYANKFIEYPDIQILLNPGSTCVKYTTANLCYNVVHFQPMILRPKSRGYITISTRDPFAKPLIYLNYFNASEDIDIVVDSYEVAKRLANTKALQEMAITLNTTFLPTREQIETGSNPLWQGPPKDFSYSICHAAGTCKMGPDTDPDAVVDPYLNVYGIKQLRVIDASIIPKILSGNLNAAVIMIGEKGADEIKKSYLSDL